MKTKKNKYETAQAVLVQSQLSESQAAQIIDTLKSWDEPLLFAAYNLGGVCDRHGHTIDEHVGVSDEYLMSRASHMPYSVIEPQGATRFLTKDVAEIAELVRKTILDPINLAKLACFVKSNAVGKVVLDLEFGYQTGEGFFSGADYGRKWSVSALTVVLKKNEERGFRVHTAYPSASSDEKDEIGSNIDEHHKWVLPKELTEIGLDPGKERS